MVSRTPLYLLPALLLTSCIHYNYSPNLVATPFITEKNESSLSANVGGLVSSKFDIQAAYNPVKHVTVMANYFDALDNFNNTNTFSTENSKESYRIRYFEGAVGGSLPIYDSGMGIGLYLGAGTGAAKNDFGVMRFTELRFTKAFFQPTLTFKSRHFRVGFATRFSQLAYGKGKIDLGIPESDLFAYHQIEQYSPFSLWETGINMGMTVKAVTLSLSFVRGQLLDDSKFDTAPFDLSNMSIGLTVDLHKLYKKKKAEKPKEGPEPPETNTPNQSSDTH